MELFSRIKLTWIFVGNLLFSVLNFFQPITCTCTGGLLLESGTLTDVNLDPKTLGFLLENQALKTPN
jgi:hypothetical protein